MSTEQVMWLPGWYASRLHAVPATTPLPEEKMATVTSLCGHQVYREAPTEWAANLVAHGVPRCKWCERKLSPDQQSSAEAAQHIAIRQWNLLAQFARTLERENNALRKRVEELESRLTIATRHLTTDATIDHVTPK